MRGCSTVAIFRLMNCTSAPLAVIHMLVAGKLRFGQFRSNFTMLDKASLTLTHSRNEK